MTIDKDQSGKAIELHNHQVLARWTFSGKTLQFSEVEKTTDTFETDSMDAAFEHTRAFLRSIKRRNAAQPSAPWSGDRALVRDLVIPRVVARENSPQRERLTGPENRSSGP